MKTIKESNLDGYKVSLTKMDVDYFGGSYAVHIFYGKTLVNEKLGFSLESGKEAYMNTLNSVGLHLGNQKFHTYNN